MRCGVGIQPLPEGGLNDPGGPQLHGGPGIVVTSMEGGRGFKLAPRSGAAHNVTGMAFRLS